MDKKNHIFSNFFLQHGKRMTFKKGEIIIRSDNSPAGVYFIESGYVRIYSISEEGDAKLHVIYKPGEIFPLLWAFKDYKRSIYYEAMGNVTAYMAVRQTFLTFLASEPKETMPELSERVATSFYIHIDRIENLEITKSYPRLVSRLLSLAKRFGEKYDGDSIIIMAPVTQNDIANSIAMTRETTSREISRLEKKKLIGYKNHLIIINDVEKLKKELSDFYDNRL